MRHNEVAGSSESVREKKKKKGESTQEQFIIGSSEICWRQYRGPDAYVLPSRAG